MGYEIPLVCKEVYLPLDDTFLRDGPSLEVYKKKYGIDLREVFNIRFIENDPPLILMILQFLHL